MTTATVHDYGHGSILRSDCPNHGQLNLYLDILMAFDRVIHSLAELFSHSSFLILVQCIFFRFLDVLVLVRPIIKSSIFWNISSRGRRPMKHLNDAEMAEWLGWSCEDSDVWVRFLLPEDNLGFYLFGIVALRIIMS